MVFACFEGILGSKKEYDHAKSEASYMADYSSPPPWPIFIGVNATGGCLGGVAKSLTPPPIAMMDMIMGFTVSQLLYTVARLKIADILVAQPKTAEEIASEVGTDPQRTRRILNACVANGVFAMKPNDPTASYYTNSKLSAVFRTDHPHCMRDMVMHQMNDGYDAWAFLHDAVQSKHEVVFETRTRTAVEQKKNGQKIGLWNAYNQDPTREATFQGAMTSLDSLGAQAMVNDCKPLASAKRVIDIGTSQGHFLLKCLASYPKLKGIGTDLPSVIATVDANLKKMPAASQEAAKRATFQVGDFMKCQFPDFEDGDVIIMRYILHDWSEKDTITILTNLRKAVGNKKVSLLIGESAIGDDPSAEVVPVRPIIDVHMMVIFDGSDRPPSVWKNLLKKTGWEFSKNYATRSLLGWTEAVPI